MSFDKAAALNALIMSAGYVGYFSLWDSVKSDLTYPERVLIGAVLTISLTIFIGWTIKTQWMLAQQQLKFSQMISAIDLGNADALNAVIDKIRADAATARVSAQRLIPLVMGSAVAFGALGAITMVIECFAHLAAGR